MNSLPEKSQKAALTKPAPAKPKSKDGPKKESFVNWYAKNKKNLQEEFPNLNRAELTKISLTRYQEQSKSDSVACSSTTTNTREESKKRKLSNPEDEQGVEAKRSTSSILSEFAYDK